MADKRTFKAPFRRRKEGKTNYAKRLALVKNSQARLVVRKSNRHIRTELMVLDAKGDKTLAAASTLELKGFGWNGATNNLPAGYLVGLLIGKKALSQGTQAAVLDLGLQTPHHKGVLFAVVKGAKEAGLNLPVNEEVLPPMERIEGKHLAGAVVAASKHQFADAKKNGFAPEKSKETVEKAKQNILNGKTGK